MEEFGNVISYAWSLMGIEFSLYGFTFSFQSVFIWGILALIIFTFIRFILDI